MRSRFLVILSRRTVSAAWSSLRLALEMATRYSLICVPSYASLPETRSNGLATLDATLDKWALMRRRKRAARA
ncbi:MAG: hypothetical protein ACI8P2_003739 [Candidatus Latescibacterota bacterium]|jgi:hypothetical protein